MAIVVVAGLVVSAVALAFAPALMPTDYSWLSHTTSESAAQGVPGAWLARSGFVLFGLAVLALAAIRRRAWGRAGTGLHAVFGVCMLAVAVFSTRPWRPDAVYDRAEDLLHSVAATAMGVAFAVGVLAVMLREWRHTGRRRWPWDIGAVAAAVLLPLAMTVQPAAAGGWQRLMFLVAYAWYLAEAIRAPHRRVL